MDKEQSLNALLGIGMDLQKINMEREETRGDLEAFKLNVPKWERDLREKIVLAVGLLELDELDKVSKAVIGLCEERYYSGPPKVS